GRRALVGRRRGGRVDRLSGILARGARFHCECSPWGRNSRDGARGWACGWSSWARVASLADVAGCAPMPVNPDAVGKRFPPLTYAVGREKVREFAHAAGETEPPYLDVEAARDRKSRRLNSSNVQRCHAA